MELFLLGLVAGGVVGMGARRVAGPLAKGCAALTNKTREVAANARESFRDVVEEARYEREQALAARANPVEEETVEVTRPMRRRRRSATTTSAT